MNLRRAAWPQKPGAGAWGLSDKEEQSIMKIADRTSSNVEAPRRARIGVATLIAALLLGAASAPAVIAKPRVPPGMVAYDKPVFKNGRRVLYHGPSQGGKAAKASRAAPSKPSAAAGKNAAAATAGKAPPGAIEPPAAVAAGALGAAVAAPALFGAAPADVVRLTLTMDPRLGAELAQALAPKGIELTLAAEGPTDLLVTPMPLGGRATAPVGLVAIARLFDCEVALIGAGAARTIADLAGKRVAAPAASGEAGRMARRLFQAAGVTATFVDVAPGEGAAALRAGQADAYVVISAALTLSDAPEGARLLAIPYRGALRDHFLPTELGKATFPALIEAGSVDTVAQPVILAAADPGRDPARRAALARFTEAFFSALGAGALPDAKWRDVNPAAKLPFQRFEAAQAWIDEARPN